MTRIFIVLSGEHASLPGAEIDSILASEGYQSKLLAKHDDVVIIESAEEIYPLLKQRSSMTIAAGRLLFVSRPSERAIIKRTSRAGSSLLGRNSLCVRVKRFRGAHPELSRSKLERDLGRVLIGSARQRVRVDLRHPDASLLGVITSDAFVFGELKVKVDRGAFDKRRPRTRPFFKPGVLEPRVARVFVNLSRLNSSKLFYDPFVGTGGFLVEACMVARYAMGSDADLRMVKGAKSNLEHYNFANFDLFLADAAHIPLRRLEFLSFDPPYGRATSTRRRLTEELILSSLREISRIIAKAGYVVLAFPSQLDVESKLPYSWFSVVERHSMRVHRSLTRSILVLRRV